MRDNTCKDIGPGRDNFLQGNIGDGINDVRKLNIAYDAGVDPHAMAWTMWVSTGPNHFYHYWVYRNGVDNATRWLLYTVERYHEPVIVAVQGGSHWILVIGYNSDYPAYPGPPGNITQIRIADPFYGTKQWFPYQGGIGEKAWVDYWFTPYTSPYVPDPATGWYVPPPDHWRSYWVTIERDEKSYAYPDIGMSMDGDIPPHYRIYAPVITSGDE